MAVTDLRGGAARLEVEWIDSGSEQGWHEEDDVLAKVERDGYLTCLSIGYLIYEDDYRLTLAAGLATSGRSSRLVGDAMTIPKVAVVDRRELRR